MNNSLLNRFTPKEPKFFPLLRQMAVVLDKASDLMIETLKSKDHNEMVEYYKKIKEQERQGDKLSHRIFDELSATFITPFDREDIHHLATLLDDVIDGINSCAKRIAIYNPKQIPPSSVELADLLKEGSILIGKAMAELDSVKKSASRARVNDYCRELHELENKADDVYEHFIMKLFEEEKNGIELIKIKEIMYELEKTTDAAEMVGKVVKTIIVKYA